MATELESFSPRHAVVGYGGASKNWPAFVVGVEGVKRIVLNEHGHVSVTFENGDVLRLVGTTDAWGVEKGAEVKARRGVETLG